MSDNLLLYKNDSKQFLDLGVEDVQRRESRVGRHSLHGVREMSQTSGDCGARIHLCPYYGEHGHDLTDLQGTGPAWRKSRKVPVTRIPTIPPQTLK